MKRKKRAQTYLILFAVVVLAAVGYFTLISPIWQSIGLGLDLQGGIHVELQAQPQNGQKVTSQEMKTAEAVIAQRVNGLGLKQPDIRLKGSDRIIVEIPGVKDPEQAIQTIGTTAKLQFIVLPPPFNSQASGKSQDQLVKLLKNHGKVVVDGSELTHAQVSFDQLGKAQVSLQFNNKGAQAFAQATGNNVGKPIYIVLDNKIIESPTVQQKITGGQARITGQFTDQEASHLAVLLNSGSLPVNFKILSPQYVSALLGTDSIQASERAAILAILLVIAIMLLLFRSPGIWADVSLAVYMFLVLAAMAALHAVLTLPGIAGLILSVGMAVDANVIIFERIREELRLGKSMHAALDAGLKHGLRAIVDGNVTTLFIAGVLFFYFSSGPLRGFAVTLSLGIILSMLTAVVLTQYLLKLSLDAGLIKNDPSFFGVRGQDH